MKRLATIERELRLNGDYLEEQITESEFSMMDVVPLSQLARIVYESCKKTSDGLSDISTEVLSLYTVLKEVGEECSASNLLSTPKGLATIGTGSREALKHMQLLVGRSRIMEASLRLHSADPAELKSRFAVSTVKWSEILRYVVSDC